MQSELPLALLRQMFGFVPHARILVRSITRPVAKSIRRFGMAWTCRSSSNCLMRCSSRCWFTPRLESSMAAHRLGCGPHDHACAIRSATTIAERISVSTCRAACPTTRWYRQTPDWRAVPDPIEMINLSRRLTRLHPHLRSVLPRPQTKQPRA
jgi:hypothetical protein